MGTRPAPGALLSRAALAAALLGCSACTYEVACDRNQGEVNCTIHKWFAGIPTETLQVRGVTGARIATSRGSKGSTLTAVALTSPSGDVRISGASGGMDSAQESKQQMVSEVNEWVANNTAAPLRVRMREGFLAWTVALIVFGGAAATSLLRRVQPLLEARRQQQKHPEMLFAVDEPPPDAALYCRACGDQVPAGNIDMRNKMARCGACHAMFDVSAQIAAAGPAQKRRASVPLPAGIEVHELQGGSMQESMPYRGKPSQPAFEIVRRWYSPDRLYMLVFGIVWTAFTLAMFAGGGGPALSIMVPLFFAPGGFVMYYGLAGLLNRTYIRVQDGLLTIRHRPLPWAGKKDLAADTLGQLYVLERTHKDKNGTTRTYDLLARLRDGQVVVLLDHLPTPAQALFLEQQIESRLGIVDVEVEGAYLRLSITFHPSITGQQRGAEIG